MQVQQAIFTSSDRSQIKGYQLVAKSANIDRHIAQELHRWSPSQLGSDDPAAWTLNYFPVSEDEVAVSRTVRGGPEYSSRGGSQVVTLIAVLGNEEFAAYHNNAVLVAQTAMTLGWLRLPLGVPSRTLETFELPDSPFVGHDSDQELGGQQITNRVPSQHRNPPDPPDGLEPNVQFEIVKYLNQKKRLAIVGASSPRKAVAKLISQMPLPNRREFSFTTGLPPALHRPFQAHFLPSTNPVLNQLLKSEGIVPVHVP